MGKNDNGNNGRTELVFVVDRSGSMDAPLIFMPMDRESKPRSRPLPVPRPPCAEVLTLMTSARRTFLVVFVMTIGLVVE